jgi:hypothetical protein
MEEQWLSIMGFGFVMMGLLFVVWMLIKWDKEDPNK